MILTKKERISTSKWYNPFTWGTYKIVEKSTTIDELEKKTKYSLTILGEDRFYFTKGDDGLICINHKFWSTVGFGATIDLAIKDMIKRALIIKDVYLNIPNTELSDEAIKLKTWLSGIRITTYADDHLDNNSSSSKLSLN